MAEFLLYRSEAELPGRLPAVCMRCGRPRERIIQKTFRQKAMTWSGIHIIDFFLMPIYVFAPIKKMTVPVSLCHRHVRHWMWSWLNLIGLLVPSLGLLAIYLSGWPELTAKAWWSQPITARLLLILALSLWLLIGIGLGIWLDPIRAEQIEKESIVLRGAAKTFCTALEKHRKDRLG